MMIVIITTTSVSISCSFISAWKPSLGTYLNQYLTTPQPSLFPTIHKASHSFMFVSQTVNWSLPFKVTCFLVIECCLGDSYLHCLLTIPVSLSYLFLFCHILIVSLFPLSLCFTLVQLGSQSWIVLTHKWPVSLFQQNTLSLTLSSISLYFTHNIW